MSILWLNWPWRDRLRFAALLAVLMAGDLAEQAWWWLTSRRCGCGAMRLRGGSCELAGVKHRTDGPCFRCDTYGNPL